MHVYAIAFPVVIYYVTGCGSSQIIATEFDVSVLTEFTRPFQDSNPSHYIDILQLGQNVLHASPPTVRQPLSHLVPLHTNW